jgi:hypothetical protein
VASGWTSAGRSMSCIPVRTGQPSHAGSSRGGAASGLVDPEHLGEVAVAHFQQDRLHAQVAEGGEVREDLVARTLERLAPIFMADEPRRPPRGVR